MRITRTWQNVLLEHSTWWSGITKQIKQKVENCVIFACEAVKAQEPLMTTLLPNRPWQRIATDVFQWNSCMYIVVVDYFSCNIEVANLIITTTLHMIDKLESIFAHHGVPETVVTDNVPQFSPTSHHLVCILPSTKHQLT